MAQTPEKIRQKRIQKVKTSMKSTGQGLGIIDSVSEVLRNGNPLNNKPFDDIENVYKVRQKVLGEDYDIVPPCDS